MTVHQISIFLENRAGQLAQVTRVLADNNIDMRAISIAETTDYGVLRLIVNDAELATGILLYCIGALSIVGPVMSALYGENTFLFTNATLDLVTSAVLATTYGIGMVLAAPVLFLWQGGIYLVTAIAGNIIPDALVTEISVTGGVLIASSGLGILGIKDCRTMNLLPSLLVPVAFFLLKYLWFLFIG